MCKNDGKSTLGYSIRVFGVHFFPWAEESGAGRKASILSSAVASLLRRNGVLFVVKSYKFAGSNLLWIEDNVCLVAVLVIRREVFRHLVVVLMVS